MKFAALLLAFAVATPAAAEDFAPLALNSLTATPARITAAPVLNQNGTVIGKVRAVVTDQDGRPAALSYVSGKRLAVVGAAAVSYDAARNIVVADVSKARLGEEIASN